MADARVLLLETGPADRNPNIHRPAGLFKLFDGDLTWNYRTAPQRHAGDRKKLFLQGRVIGGGSSVNGQVFTQVALRQAQPVTAPSQVAIGDRLGLR